MGLEGAVKLGMRRELEAIEDAHEREEMERSLVEEMYNRGKAVRVAEMGEIDSVIDPAETVDWLRRCLGSVHSRVATVDQRERREMGTRLWVEDCESID